MSTILPHTELDDTATSELLSLLSREAPHPPLTPAGWENAAEASLRYRVAGLTLHHVRGHRLRPPAKVDALLRDEARALAARAAGNWWLFDQIAQGLTKASIPFIRLKGSHLARCVYSSPSHRFQRDFDILVREEQLVEAQRIIELLGFERSEAFEGYNLTLKKADAPFCLELHWDVQRRPWLFDIKVDDLWRRAEPASDGLGLRLSLEDEVAYLTLHISKHRFWGELIPFLDILQLLDSAQTSLCCRTLEQRFDQWQARRPAALVIAVLARLFPRDVPPELACLLLPPPEKVVEYAEWRVRARDDQHLEDRKRIVRVTTFQRHSRLWSPLLDSQPGLPPRNGAQKISLALGKAWRLGRSLSLAIFGGKTERARLVMEKELCEWC